MMMMMIAPLQLVIHPAPVSNPPQTHTYLNEPATVFANQALLKQGQPCLSIPPPLTGPCRAPVCHPPAPRSRHTAAHPHRRSHCAGCRRPRAARHAAGARGISGGGRGGGACAGAGGMGPGCQPPPGTCFEEGSCVVVAVLWAVFAGIVVCVCCCVVGSVWKNCSVYLLLCC